MPLINSLISWVIKKRIHQIELFMKYPYDVQYEWFKKLIFNGRDTEWGKKYDYKSIRNYEEFKHRVPLNDYNSLKPYIERLRAGEQNLLWNSEIKWFAKSSGTTADKSKFIPVSTEAIEECHFNGGKDMLSIYCNNHPDTLIFDGKGLGLGGSHNMGQVNNESYYGDLSAIIIQNLPFWAEFNRTPNLTIALMDEWEEKLEKMAHFTLRENVTNIYGVPSWTLLLMNRILEITKKSNITEVWPNLEVFFHGGVSFNPYREQFKKIFPASMQYLETYNASEGFFGIQDRTGYDDMLLMLDYGVYYEFIPANEIDKEFPAVKSLDEVETDVNYALVISTNGGLWRYKIGDTITFTSTNPYRFRITGRTKLFINSVGEELIIDNTEKAIEIACRKAGLSVVEYTVAPLFYSDDKTVVHQWLIEFGHLPENTEYFCEILDNALKALNSDYEAKRYHNLILKPPLITPVPKGTFFNWLKSKGKLGGQHKVPRLANDRRFIEEILTMIK